MSKFQPGQSGNPNGKPPGPNRLTRAMRERIADECDPVTFLGSVMKGEPQAYTVEAEADGEAPQTAYHTPSMDQRMAAARSLVGKVCPDAKDRPITFEVGDIAGPTDALQCMARVVTAMGAGELSPVEATSVMNVIGVYLAAWEASEMEARLKALEESNGVRS